MEQPIKTKPEYKSESSVINHPYQIPQKGAQVALPTWALLVILIIAFFILKYFIYIKDEQRHGK